jgi:hypothetical protein
MSELKGFVQTVLAALISGSVVAAIVGTVLKSRLDERFEESKSTRNRNEALLTEVIGPATMHIARTEAIAARYGRQSARQRFAEADLLRASNETMRNLLISKGYLIPTKLMRDSQCLVVHYDIWLKRFEATMDKFKAEHDGKAPSANDTFDVGFSELEDSECGGFDKKAPKLYADEFQRLRKELYGID